MANKLWGEILVDKISLDLGKLAAGVFTIELRIKKKIRIPDTKISGP